VQFFSFSVFTPFATFAISDEEALQLPPTHAEPLWTSLYLRENEKKAGEKVSTAFGSYRSTFGCFFFLVRLSSYLFLWPTIFRRLLI